MRTTSGGRKIPCLSKSVWGRLGCLRYVATVAGDALWGGEEGRIPEFGGKFRGSGSVR